MKRKTMEMLSGVAVIKNQPQTSLLQKHAAHCVDKSQPPPPPLLNTLRSTLALFSASAMSRPFSRPAVYGDKCHVPVYRLILTGTWTG